jgi:hypothetical protein
MPIPLGIFAVAGNGAAAGAYELISTSTASGATSITFSSIPQTYKHLQLRFVAKSDTTSTGYCLPAFRFNADSGANYAIHEFFGDGTNIQAQALLSRNAGQFAQLIDSYNSTNQFGSSILDIFDYTSTTKNKTTRALGGYGPGNGDERISLFSTAWFNTAAITSITLLFATYGGNFVSGSRVSLYGIKG